MKTPNGSAFSLLALMSVVMLVGCGGTQQSSSSGLLSTGSDMMGNNALGAGAKKGDPGKKQPDLGPLAVMNGYVAFGTKTSWNLSVEKLPLLDGSAKIVANLGETLKVGFGSKVGDAQPFGIPYLVVGGDAVRVGVNIKDKSEQMPIPLQGTPIEAAAPHRLIVVDRDMERLYELTGAAKTETGYTATASEVVDMRNPVEPLPNVVFPGLVRFDEASDRHILSHALSVAAPAKVPLGTRLRLKKAVSEKKLSETTLTILHALKKYGAVVVANEESFTLLGTPDTKWKTEDLDPLAKLKASDFEAVKLPAPKKAKVPAELEPKSPIKK